ncbi:uncharacterized protein LOC113367788 [Ctenocephalides felis]|uniref:uncharacterized protein LOC113367788 n=1 Tax=Ctenocephalides felis TaxID=7515 RepID=UPI000E6E1714|nr:uncharacterized protein LOC113367788 [Ctenocephalides felis]
MSEVNESSEPATCFYLPHHGVIKPDSLTTKLRVVFDASCKTDAGLSLNELQLVGPTIQNNIFSIILRFRRHAFVLTADIEKMYRQVLVHENDRKMQRIFWRDNPSSKLKIYQLNTVTYGTASAPFLAIRCLEQLARENITNYTKECEILRNDFYVDDLLTGTDNISELFTIKNNLYNPTLNIGEQTIKTLGISWNSVTDSFEFDYKNIKINQIVKARSRVAPLKNITLPRLELCAAQLLANLAQITKRALNIAFDKEFYWSDSTITLSWIRSPSYKWKTFVANRVSDIQTKTDANNWLHVRSEDNPADLISRGCYTHDLLNSSLWWAGPSWLQNLTETQRRATDNISIPETDVESRITSLTCTKINNNEHFFLYSSLIKLVRVTAFCYRFLQNLKLKKKEKELLYGPLTVDEFNNSLNKLIKISQYEIFKQDIDIVARGEALHKSSKLKSLTPFLDKNGILRVGGRIKNSNLPYDKCHPIILPKNHQLTILITRHEHLKLYHCGAQMLLNALRNTYWPIGGRNLTRSIVKKCVTCFKVKPTFINPVMGNLPKYRVTPQSPFFICGVDYGGPILLRDRQTRGYKKFKAYICLFVCLVTKAIHIELVSDLTTNSFLATFKRFMARRGKPREIYSDNGTNFIGAASGLKELYKFLQQKSNQNKIVNDMTNEGVSWKHIPPNSPHFGGIWEAGIKSCKAHLKRVLGNAILTFEDFYTVLTQIEAILNSRPISPLSSDPNDYDPLTPGHFLIGKSLTSTPDPSVLETLDNRLSRYQRLQKLVQHFWKRWHKEYVSELQARTKWQVQPSQPAEVGDMVVVREDNLPPLHWRLGRILDTHPGDDGLVRVVTIKTQNGVLKRAINRVCVLPKQ